MSSCERGVGGRGGGERSRWATNFFNGIFKDGFKLEVISMFMFEQRKSTNCVLACDCVNVHAAPSVCEGWQQFKPETIYANHHLTALFAN